MISRILRQPGDEDLAFVQSELHAEIHLESMFESGQNTQDREQIVVRREPGRQPRKTKCPAIWRCPRLSRQMPQAHCCVVEGMASTTAPTSASSWTKIASVVKRGHPRKRLAYSWQRSGALPA